MHQLGGLGPADHRWQTLDGNGRSTKVFHQESLCSKGLLVLQEVGAIGLGQSLSFASPLD